MEFGNIKHFGYICIIRKKIVMNENLDLCEILKDCPKGTKLWSSVWGDVTLVRINGENPFPIVLATKVGSAYALLRSNGKMYDVKEAECLLFPSKDQRDWSKFKVPIKRFDPKTFKPFDKVLVRKGEESFHWAPHLFGMLIKNSEDSYNVIGIGNTNIWRRCIPYNDDTKHLIGSTDDCPEYYKWWEHR